MAPHTLLSFSFHLIRPIHCSLQYNSGTAEEEFTEQLLLKPLPDRKVAAHFHFRTVAPPSPHTAKHHHLFPKSISQLVKKHHISELELSFTQGRWNYEKWGGSDPYQQATPSRQVSSYGADSTLFPNPQSTPRGATSRTLFGDFFARRKTF